MKTDLRNFVSLVLQESLKKDIKRHEIARKLYNYMIVAVSEAIRTPKSISQGGTFHTSGNEVVLAMDDGEIVIFMSAQLIPDDIKAELIPQGPDLPRLQDLYIKMHARDKLDQQEVQGLYKGSGSRMGVRTIEIKVPEEELQVRNKPGEEQREVALRAIKSRRSTLIHELAHMIDELSLMGDEAFNQRSLPARRRADLDSPEGLRHYYKLGLEVNARWAEVLDDLDPLPYSDYDPENDWRWEEWLDRAKIKIRFEELPVAKQRKFVGRLWEFFKAGPYVMPPGRLEEAAQLLLKEFKSYMRNLTSTHEYPPREYRREVMRYLGTWQGYIENSDIAYNHGTLRIPETRYDYSQENTEAILARTEELAKPLEAEFKKWFAGVEEKYKADDDYS